MEKFIDIREQAKGKARAALAGIAGLAVLSTGCGIMIEHDNAVDPCEQPVSELTPATPDTDSPQYRLETDPAVLAEELMIDTQNEILGDADNPETIPDKLQSVRQVGVGRVACAGPDGTWYLTAKGMRISKELDK